MTRNSFYLSAALFVLLPLCAFAQQGTNLPMWALAVNGPAAQSVNWTKTPQEPPEVRRLTQSGSSVLGSSSVAMDNCGNIAFIVLYNNGLLHIHTDQGRRLTNATSNSPLRGLVSPGGNTEVQIVRVPKTLNEWYIIYSRGTNVYAKSVIVYAQVRYNMGTQALSFVDGKREVTIAANCVHGKAVSPNVPGIPNSHYLYLMERSIDPIPGVPNSETNDIVVRRFLIQATGITPVDQSEAIPAKFEALSIGNSPVELSRDGQRLAIVNRHEYRGTGPKDYYGDILLFNTTNLAADPVIVSIPSLIMPEQQGSSIYDFAVLNSAHKCLRNINSKIVDIEFSPSGRFLYVSGGGFAGEAADMTALHDSYLIQIDLQGGVAPNYHVRLQIEGTPNRNINTCQGGVMDTTYHAIGLIESAFDGNLYFSKSNSSRYFVIPSPDNVMEHSVVPAKINLQTNEERNLLMLDDAMVSNMPENIDGYDYIPDGDPVEAAMTLDKHDILLSDVVNLTVVGRNAMFTYAANWGDGKQQSIPGVQIPHSYDAGGTYVIRLTATNVFGCSASASDTISVQNVLIPLCETIVPWISEADEVKLDTYSGRYIFQKNINCSPPIEFSCVQGPATPLLYSNVVSASATTFSDNWSYGYLGNVSSTLGGVEKGEIGKWREQANYVFNRSQVKVDKNYNSGTFQLAFFNWQYPNVSERNGWLKTRQAIKYSPDGENLEEVDALGIPSASKFGYDDALPYLIAHNGRYGSVMFESFENFYDSRYLEDGVTVDNGAGAVSTGEAHSGSNAFIIGSGFTSRQFEVDDQLRSKGMVVRLWALGDDIATSLKLRVVPANFTATSDPLKFNFVARSGKWSLWQVDVPPSLLESMTAFNLSVIKTGTSQIQIDDVRIQPTDAEMTCYVYDRKALRVITILDDQHFGLFFQYNMEGQLVRKMKETVRGMKTVQETQYNTPDRQ